MSFFLAKRLRATSAAAAPPNSRIIGGAGTGEGPSGLPDDVPLDPWPFDDQPPFEFQPPHLYLHSQPFDELPDEVEVEVDPDVEVEPEVDEEVDVEPLVEEEVETSPLDEVVELT